MARKPWPMAWIVAAILLFIGPYTYLTLRYRKPASFEPFQDARERRHLAQEGYARTTLRAAPQPEPLPGAPAVSALGSPAVVAAPGGLPADLSAGLLEPPLVPRDIVDVRASSVWDGGKPYVVSLRCDPPPGQVDLAGAHLYRKGSELVVVVGFARLAEGLVKRRPDDRVEVTFPIAAVDPGSYRMTLVGQRKSLSWPLLVH